MLKETVYGTVDIKLYCARIHEKEYDVYLVSDDSWPPDWVLARLCDGADLETPEEDLLFKDSVILPGESKNHKIVKIFS